MKAIKVAVLTLLLSVLAACGSDAPKTELSATQVLMDYTSQGEKDGVHVLTTFNCDETTGLRSSFSMKATNVTDADITVRFTLRKRSLGNSDDGPRTTIRDTVLKPQKSDIVEQDPAPSGFNYVVGVFKIEAGGSENHIAHAAIGADNKCQKDRKDGGNDL